MKFKLYKDVVPEYSALSQILHNRDIPIEKQEEWLNAGWEQINDWRLLNENKMRQGVKLVKDTMDNNGNIIVVIDSDCDGWTSAAIFINYLTLLDEEYAKKHIFWIQHKGKEHGLQDVTSSILADFNDISLVVCPDSASNDIESQNVLFDNGISCLILDHHECDRADETEHAIIINPQLCNYPNKSLTGAGVTWQFCRAFEEIYGKAYVDLLLDLAALGDCGDMADYRQIEIRALMNLGLSNIHNPFFHTMAKKNSFSIDKMNGINYYSVAFYVVPFINALVRSGLPEEKELVFKSFLLLYAFDEVDSSKRGHKGEKVKLYDEAVLVAERVKRRQTKLQDEAMALLEKRIQEQNLLDNAIVVCLCEPGDVEKNIAGLVANKLMAKYQKPCLVLTKNKTKDDEEYYYRGSARNYGRSEIEDLRQVCLDTDMVEFAQGHAAAFGCSIPESNLQGFIDCTNKIYNEIDQTPVYWVDYIWSSKNTIDSNKILDIGRFNIYGQEIPESYIALDRIPINASMVTLMSPDKHPTLKIQIGDVSLIKFKSSQEEYEKFCEEDNILTAICKCNINEWNGNEYLQLIVEDYELDQEWVF